MEQLTRSSNIVLSTKSATEAPDLPLGHYQVKGLKLYMRSLFQLSYLAIRDNKVTFTLYLGCALMASFLGLASLWVTRGLTNSMVQFVSFGDAIRGMENVLIFILFQAGIEVTQFVTNKASSSLLSVKLGTQATIGMMRILFHSLWRTELSEIEGSAKILQLTTLQSGVQLYGAQIMPTIYGMVKGILGIVIYLTVLSTASRWITLLVLFLTLPTAFVNYKFIAQDLNLLRNTAPDQRLASRLLYQMTTPSALRDARIFGYGALLLNRWQLALTSAVNKQLRVQLRQAGYSTLAVMAGQVLTAFAILIVLWEGRAQHMSLGANLALIQAMGSLETDLTTLLSSVVKLYEVQRYLVNVNHFKPKSSTARGPSENTLKELPDKIQVQRLTYTYPSRSEPAVKEVSLSIEDGEKVVIVGRNGSGKSTLVKCIMGIYRPTGGNVFHSGTGVDDYREKVACVFQDFEIYPLSVLENIILGNPDQPIDSEKVGHLVSELGMDAAIQRLPHGLDTILDTSFQGGSILSQGELQKIAICRALYAKPSLLVLDEPTASLDPVAESEIYTRVLELMSQQTVIMISHRLNVCPLVDRVVVMEDGEVVDIGTHYELLRRCEVYKQMHHRLIIERDATPTV